MKLSAQLILLTAAVLIFGCASKKPVSIGNSIANAPQMIVAPDSSLAAKVVRCNSAARFVVLSFPAGQMPKPDQTLFLYRGGLKVAEIKINSWQQENLVVADVTSGEAQTGDEVRDQ
jgi:hypothetical protein